MTQLSSILKSIQFRTLGERQELSHLVQHTVSDAAGLGFVKLDHLGSFGANLNLFVELQTQENYV